MAYAAGLVSTWKPKKTNLMTGRRNFGRDIWWRPRRIWWVVASNGRARHYWAGYASSSYLCHNCPV